MYSVIILAILAAVCVSVATASVDNKIFGLYSDPYHPSCPRYFVPDMQSDRQGDANVYGQDSTDGEGASCGQGKDEDWGPCPATINGDKLVVDLSSKGGPSDLTGTFANDRITWSDGNYWQKAGSIMKE